MEPGRRAGIATTQALAALQDVLTLPYARPYFFALGVKLAAYALMVGSIPPLVRGARRRVAGRKVGDRPTLWPWPT